MKDANDLANIRLCIIILNWNSYEDTFRAIESMAGCEWAITVVDNASSNRMEAVTIRQRHPHVTVLENARNLGYAGGMNVGLKWATANGFSHSLLLNPDTLPSIAVIASMLRLSPGYAVVGTAQVTEEHIPYVSAAHMRARKPVPFTCESSCGNGHDVDIVSGAAILVELSTAAKLNFIDEDFFHYKEEFDFCYRVGASGGRLRYNCGNALIHRRGGSLPIASPTAVYYSFRNELLFLRKHFGKLGWLSGLGLFRTALLTSLKSPEVAFAVLRGVLHGIRGIYGPVASLKRSGALN